MTFLQKRHSGIKSYRAVKIVTDIAEKSMKGWSTAFYGRRGPGDGSQPFLSMGISYVRLRCQIVRFLWYITKRFCGGWKT